MATTPNLLFPYLEAAQSQKHVTHNEALARLDALVQIAVADRDLASPPASPADGARYIVAPGASGAWAGHATRIAAYQDGAWELYAPREGWLAWVADEDVLLVWNGGAWIAAASGGGGGGSVNPAPLVGVNATADTTNRLSVASPAALFSHEGAGHQLKINKAAAADTASIVFQTAFSGRAEMGLAGNDDYRFKVSANGTTWNEAIVIDRTTGAVTFPNTSLGGGGVSDHGALTGLADDDHAQYHTDARGDARYYTKAQSDAALAAKAAKTQTDFIAGLIKSPANQDYRLVVNIPHAGTITKVTTRSASGSCTATFKINTTALGGAANSVSSTEQEQAHSSANAFVAGDDIVLTVSANASCADMSFTIELTRALS